eukprot:gene4646-6530_t
MPEINKDIEVAIQQAVHIFNESNIRDYNQITNRKMDDYFMNEPNLENNHLFFNHAKSYDDMTEKSGNSNSNSDSNTKEKLITPKSFHDGDFKSKEMMKIISLNEPEPLNSSHPGLNNINYQSSSVFPDWVLSSNLWKNFNKPDLDQGSEISSIFKLPLSKRTPQQTSAAIYWLMSVWKIAETMGIKKCASMLKEFNYENFEPGQEIIVEGDCGLTMYIILSGMVSVHKLGIGVVGQLSTGKVFGEIALTQGKDLRTATITATTAVEVLSLTKNDFEYFVRALQDSERRENFQVLSACKLFK